MKTIVHKRVKIVLKHSSHMLEPGTSNDVPYLTAIWLFRNARGAIEAVPDCGLSSQGTRWREGWRVIHEFPSLPDGDPRQALVERHLKHCGQHMENDDLQAFELSVLRLMVVINPPGCGLKHVQGSGLTIDREIEGD